MTLTNNLLEESAPQISMDEIFEMLQEPCLEDDPDAVMDVLEVCLPLPTLTQINDVIEYCNNMGINAIIKYNDFDGWRYQ